MTAISFNSFSKVLEDTFIDMIEESSYNNDLKLFLLTKSNREWIDVNGYKIKSKCINVWNTKKTFYDIIYEGEVLYRDIGSGLVLMKMLSRLINNKNIMQYDPLLTLNAKYVGSVSEALYYKTRLKQSDRITLLSKNVYEAKLNGCIDSIQRIKEQINKIS